MKVRELTPEEKEKITPLWEAVWSTGTELARASNALEVARSQSNVVNKAFDEAIKRLSPGAGYLRISECGKFLVED